MANIRVSIQGSQVSCPDIIAGSGETITWALDPTLGSIVSITPVSGNLFSSPPANIRGVWTAVIGTGKAGQIETYSISAQPSAVGSGRVSTPARGPKISVSAPIEAEAHPKK